MMLVLGFVFIPLVIAVLVIALAITIGTIFKLSISEAILAALTTYLSLYHAIAVIVGNIIGGDIRLALDLFNTILIMHALWVFYSKFDIFRDYLASAYKGIKCSPLFFLVTIAVIIIYYIAGIVFAPSSIALFIA